MLRRICLSIIFFVKFRFFTNYVAYDFSQALYVAIQVGLSHTFIQRPSHLVSQAAQLALACPILVCLRRC